MAKHNIKKHKHQQQNGVFHHQKVINKSPVRLFPKEKLKVDWKVARPVGPGLVNVGNTCFLNSVLQCLTYTPAFTQYMLTSQHSNKCSVVGFCALCAMEDHLKKCFCSKKSFKKSAAILPRPFTSNLNKISKLLRVGRQEDAHEFLMFLLQAFQKSITNGIQKVTPQIEESTSISQIFGGKIRSQITCYNCKAKTNNYEAFLDLSLDLTKAKSVEQSLKNFTEVDIIGSDPENRYNCSKCKQKVKVGKQMTISSLPPTLNLHLKRFAYNFNTGFMSKINKPFRFPEVLDMAPYISKDTQQTETIYDLYAVLVHEGRSCTSGHYFSYVKSPNGKWNLMNDEFVTPVSRGEVLSQTAYMLFYKQRESIPDKNKKEEVKDVLTEAMKEAEDVRLKSILKRKREEAEKEEEKEKKKKRVQIEELPSADDPSAWYVQRLSDPHRFLRGVLSPPTYGAAVSDESAWTQLDIDTFRKTANDKKRRYRRRKKLAGKPLKFTVKMMA